MYFVTIYLWETIYGIALRLLQIPLNTHVAILPLHLITLLQAVIKSIRQKFLDFLLLCNFEKWYCIPAAKCITTELGLEIQPRVCLQAAKKIKIKITLCISPSMPTSVKN